ncbi:two-component system sensor histidine kinase BaeS [Paenibacillus rhizosphaerae]|uniref:histidine kinase n=1 Tax=Paenibacillus rhizosphaerae TaxID=297318 RepID=A0A839TQE6_9BACL|nr:ATP-binding protein [Paenibacillus rhizosphaerae]MBB3128985.1 two-component system sensor histidine kinase BaeS [Paenibacillus rhizosphaerae]
MNVSRKLFWAMAAFIVVMSLTFMLITNAVVHGLLGELTPSPDQRQISALSRTLAEYYDRNGGSWSGIEKMAPGSLLDEVQDSGLILYDVNGRKLAIYGSAAEPMIRGLGEEYRIETNGRVVGSFRYYDPEISVISKVKLGISHGVGFLLIVCAVVFIGVALLAAYWIAKRLTSPLRQLIPAIDQVQRGRAGVQVPVTTKDEYGEVASAFNRMSLQLGRAEDARRNLVADVAHELRTPLSIMRGKMDMLQQQGEAIEPEHLLPLQDELIRLTRLVDDLHQLSLAEAGKLSFEFSRTDVRTLLEQTLERLLPRAQDAGIAMRLFSQAGSSTVIPVDSGRITQVFLNLLTNAIRHTPHGGSIQVILSEVHDAHGRPWLEIAVKDTGTGIAPEHLPNLFGRFYRADASRSRHSGGMGLGLSIAKEFVAAHQGTIDAESTAGAGTTFRVRLPYNREEQA